MDTFSIDVVGSGSDHGYAVRDLLLQRELGRFDTKRQAEAFVLGCKHAGGYDAVTLIIDLKSLLEHYVSGRADNWDGSTKTQATITIRQAEAYLNRV